MNSDNYLNNNNNNNINNKCHNLVPRVSLLRSYLMSGKKTLETKNYENLRQHLDKGYNTFES